MVTVTELTTEITLTDFTSQVEIYKSTKAKDIPTKLNVMAADLKAHTNTKVNTIQSFFNGTVVPHINTELTKIGDDHNTLVTNISNQQSTFETNITNQQNTFETNRVATETAFTDSITTQQNAYESDLTNNIGNYIGSGAGYNVAQVNSFQFSGPGSVTYDAQGRVTEAVEGPITTSNIVYNVSGKLMSFTETITIAGVPYTKTFEVGYDTKGNITGTTEIV